jgi:membrane protein implicated in regulation of membrane protease activity
MTKQSRGMSLVESIANVAVGFGVAVLTLMAVLPLFGLHVPLASNLVIGAIFTLVSIIRSYLLRRVFEEIRERSERRIAVGL